MTQPKGLIQVINTRCYELYKNGMSEDEISEEVGIPIIRVREAIHGKLINKIWRTQTMNNQLTTDQLKELLEIQKKFDSRIPTLNLQDSKVAYVVEFFEWFNTLETFKNWKKKPGKPLDVQLDELADMLAFGLSIANQMDIDEWLLMDKIGSFDGSFTGLSAGRILAHLDSFDYYNNQVPITFDIAEEYYSIDQLITAYKKKMERNHARQDGTADKDKGYV